MYCTLSFKDIAPHGMLDNCSSLHHRDGILRCFFECVLPTYSMSLTHFEHIFTVTCYNEDDLRTTLYPRPTITNQNDDSVSRDFSEYVDQHANANNILGINLRKPSDEPWTFIDCVCWIANVGSHVPKVVCSSTRSWVACACVTSFSVPCGGVLSWEWTVSRAASSLWRVLVLIAWPTNNTQTTICKLEQ